MTFQLPIIRDAKLFFQLGKDFIASYIRLSIIEMQQIPDFETFVRPRCPIAVGLARVNSIIKIFSLKTVLIKDSPDFIKLNALFAFLIITNTRNDLN